MPEFCTKCEHITETGSCSRYRKCAKWLSWFREEWQAIQEAAAAIKKDEEKEPTGE